MVVRVVVVVVAVVVAALPSLPIRSHVSEYVPSALQSKARKLAAEA